MATTPRFGSDLGGNLLALWRIGTKALNWNLKAITGGLAVRNTGDSADAELTASQFNASGNVGIVLNSDAAGSGADFKITIQRPSSGMTANWTWTLPPDDGSPGDVLTTDGSGVTTWSSAGATNGIRADDTPLVAASSGTLAMFTKPAAGRYDMLKIYVDVAFDGTAPTLSIGISGTVSKYGTTAQVDLKTVGIYEWDPGVDVTVGAENIIATYVADSSTVGSARIASAFVIPS